VRSRTGSATGLGVHKERNQAHDDDDDDDDDENDSYY
jgi:hypothetical protein